MPSEKYTSFYKRTYTFDKYAQPGPVYHGQSDGTSRLLPCLFKCVIIKEPSKRPSNDHSNDHIIHFRDWIDLSPAGGVDIMERFLVYPISGHDLSTYINSLSSNAIQDTALIHLVWQLFDAVSFCHRRGITHGDINPERLFVDASDPEEPSLMLTYDLSRDFKRSSSPLHPVAAGPYTPPDVWMKPGRNDPSVDCWACAVVIAYMSRRGDPLFSSLDSILDVIGTPSSSETFRVFGEAMPLPTFPDYQRKAMQELVESQQPIVLEVLDRLLVFDPAARLTAPDVLSEYFSVTTVDLTTESSTNHAAVVRRRQVTVTVPDGGDREESN